jgi:hypothetical protein
VTEPVNGPNILQRATGVLDRMYDRINRPIYEPPIARGNAGGGFLGATARFFRGFGREVIPNTLPELAMGGVVNPVRGFRGGGMNAWEGSAMGQRRQYGRSNDPMFAGPNERLAGGEVERQAPPRAQRATRPQRPAPTGQDSPIQAGRSGQTDPPSADGMVEIQPGVPGRSMSRSMAPPIVAQRSRVGVRGGQTIAEDQAAQDMYGGMRDAANAAIIAAADRRWRERASMIEQ